MINSGIAIKSIWVKIPKKNLRKLKNNNTSEFILKSPESFGGFFSYESIIYQNISKMNYILFDNPGRDNLLPLTFTRPVSDIRIGILTIREKWEAYLGVKTSSLTEDYLSLKHPIIKGKQNILINGSICPNEKLVSQIIKLKPNQALVHEDYLIAIHLNEADIDDLENAENIEDVETTTLHLKIEHLWDIFQKNGDAIVEDYNLLTKGRKSIKASETNTLINPEHIFIEKGAKLECAVLNATDGPIYIGANAEIMEGSVIRGPFALCEHSIVKMGAKYTDLHGWSLFKSWR